MMPRIYFIHGWGGKTPLSLGFINFGERLRKLGYDMIDSFGWAYPHEIVQNIKEIQKRGPHPPIALIGFSLGANCTSWVADSGVPIDLLVAYDPSDGFLWWRAKPPSPIGGNVRKAICYQQTGPEMVGGAKMTGNVTIVETVSPHMLVQSDERLHEITLRALSQLRKGS